MKNGVKEEVMARTERGGVTRPRIRVPFAWKVPLQQEGGALLPKPFVLK